MAQTIIVDISTRGANPVAYTHQGDTGRTFFAEIYENGEAFAVAGYTIKVGAILPADRGYTVIAGNDMVTATKTNDNTTNKIYFTLSNKYSLKAGNGILTLIFTSNTGTPSTIRPINIDLRIQKSADADDTIAGASDFPEGLESIAESVFQEYLSTYLPPVAPSSSAAANKPADAKLTGEALDDLKSDLDTLNEGGLVIKDDVIAENVENWLDEHPEATTTVQDNSLTTAKYQDGSVTNKKLAESVADSYYDNIIYNRYRKYGTDIYYVEIPVNDSDGQLIDPFFYFTPTKTPNEVAQDLKTDVTFNGAVNFKKTDSTWQVGNVISRGTPIYTGNITGELLCNDAGYFSIGSDRTWKTYPISTTQAELLADGAYNVSEFYYNLIINGQVNDFTAVQDNELNIVDGLKMPMIAIGVKATKEIVIMACDGRTETQAGLTPNEISDELLALGVVNAVSMDGGGSTSLSVKSIKVNKNDDDGGTTDRWIRFTFNVKKPNVNDFIAIPFAEIAKQKQALRTELYPYLNDIYGKIGITTSYGVHAISENADLHGIVKPGRYYTANNTISASLANCPTSVNFILDVEYMNGPAELFYTIKDYSGDVYVCRNHIYANANHFTNWICLTKGQQVTVTKNSTYITNESISAQYASGLVTIYGYFKISSAVPSSVRLFSFSDVKLMPHNYEWLVGADASLKGKLEVTGDGVALHSAGGFDAYSGYIYINATFPAYYP